QENFSAPTGGSESPYSGSPTSSPTPSPATTPVPLQPFLDKVQASEKELDKQGVSFNVSKRPHFPPGASRYHYYEVISVELAGDPDLADIPSAVTRESLAQAYSEYFKATGELLKLKRLPEEDQLT